MGKGALIVDLDRQLLLQTFTAESLENLGTLEESLLLLEQDEDGAEQLKTIFRVAHNLKGNALCLGFDHMGDYADRLEDYLERMRSGSVAITPATITQLLKITDAMRDWFSDAVLGDEPVPDRCVQLLDNLSRSQATPDEPAREVTAERSGPLFPQGERPHLSQTLRLDVAKLDRLQDLTTEMLIACGRINGVLQSMPAEIIDRLADSYEAVDQLSREVNEMVMRARMVPIGPLFRQYTRVVRDVSRGLGKSARLVIQGGEVEIDAAAFEHLRDPLTHLVRNATDHGLETADVRSAAGKEATGTITLSARRDGRTIILSVTDDGRGLDEERIRACALERGMITGDEQRGAAESRDLIFEPGFTTAREATKLSGRGVGLDVVRANIEQIRGEVVVSSSPGEGMTVTIRLPLTVTVIDGLVVKVSGETYVVPLDAVVQCTEMPGEALKGRATGVVTFQDVAVPFGRLSSLVESDPGQPNRENLLIVHHHERLAGIVVDEVLEKHNVVMKPLDDWYRRVPFVSGSTILGDGQIALILDVRAALEHIEASRSRTIGRSEVVKPRRGAAA